MKILVLVAILSVPASSGFAQVTGVAARKNPAPAPELASDEFTQAVQPKIVGWGKAVDPDKDCKFFVSKQTLIISTPASQNPHDFSPELGFANAPRVVRSVAGDFSFQVQVDDRLNPGEESMIPTRVGYNGAAVVAIADDRNIVTLARAVMKWPGREAIPYANFEIRLNGELKRLGMDNDHPLPSTGPVYLRLERQGPQITGSVSTDGSKWDVVGKETIPDDWAPKLKVGMMTVNSSKSDFSPQFSKAQLSKP